jgi:hypothetical protein
MKLILSVLFASTLLLASHTTKLEEVDKSGLFAWVKGSSSFKLGSSGIVIRDFDSEHSSIVARATVVEKQGELAKVKFMSFDDLESTSMPTPILKPKKGDKVLLNHLYNKRLVIASNVNVYKQIAKDDFIVQWLHPDLLASRLYIDKTKAPKQNDFKEVCKFYEIGQIVFALDDGDYFVDCFSFKTIKKVAKNRDTTNAQLPFYSRIQKISGSLFFNKEVKSFSNYYKGLIND